MKKQLAFESCFYDQCNLSPVRLYTETDMDFRRLLSSELHQNIFLWMEISPATSKVRLWKMISSLMSVVLKYFRNFENEFP